MLHLTVYRKAYNWRHAVQQASVEVLEGTENTFSAVLELDYVNEESNNLSIWSLAEVQGLVEYWIKRRAFEKRPNLVVHLGMEHVVMEHNKQGPAVSLEGTVDPVDLELVRQTLVEFFTFLLLELRQLSVVVRYTFQEVPQPSLKLCKK